MTTQERSTNPVADSGSSMLCPCREFQLADLRRILDEQPHISFDALQQQTGAGGTCTACLLDLEYHYTTMPRGTVARSTGAARRRRETISLKQRLYRLLDNLSPQTPMPLADYMPILYGHGLETWICVANQPLLYEAGTCATDLDLTLAVRDAGGMPLCDERVSIAAGSAQRIAVSPYFSAPASEIGIGSVRVARRFRSPGVRGTTRPQVEMISAAGVCAVHSQAPGRLRNRWLSVYHRPREERIFASAVNAAAESLRVEIEYPFADGVVPTTHTLSVPAYGAALHEIILPEPAASTIGGQLYSVRFRTGGLGKMHLFCAAPDLSRFSIDHL